MFPLYWPQKLFNGGNSAQNKGKHILVTSIFQSFLEKHAFQAEVLKIMNTLGTEKSIFHTSSHYLILCWLPFFIVTLL